MVTFTPGLIWMVIVFILLIIPGSDIPANDFFELIYFDKWVHVGLFGILTFFLGFPLIELRKYFIYVALFSIFYGTLLEFVQKYFTTTRTFDITDILADAAGAFIAVMVLIKISMHKK